MKLKFLIIAWLCCMPFGAWAQCSIIGATSVCVGGTTTLTTSGCGAGTWTITPSFIANISTSGVVTGLTSGSAVVSYTTGSGSTTQTISVNTVPAILPITGSATHRCNSAAPFTLADATSSGTWSSGTPSVASINSSGLVTIGSVGTTTISYAVTNACGTNWATMNLSIDAPITATINGSRTPFGATNCTATRPSATLIGAPGGGTWASSSGAISVSSIGGVFPSSASSICTATISYTVTNGCGTSTMTMTETDGPSALSSASVNIAGKQFMCPGSSWTFYDAIAYGSWSSSNPSVLTIGASSGGATAVATSSATAIITYSCTDACGNTASPTYTVNVGVPTSLTPPTASICVGQTATFTPVSNYYGGTWSSSSAAAPVTSSGLVNGLSVVTGATISYSCGTSSFSSTVTGNLNVTTPTSVAAITSTSTSFIYCTGTSTRLSCATSGGTWSSSDPTIATINPTTGVLNLLTPGLTCVITYTVPASTGSVCPGVTTQGISVYHTPNAGTITGTSTFCPGGSAALSLTSADAGGTWSSSNPAIVTVNSSGNITAIAAGTATISYTVTTTNCGSAVATYPISVSPNPNAGTISGPSVVCTGSTINLTTTGATGGTWISSDNSVAAVSSSGMVTGIPGITVPTPEAIVYLVYNSCGSAATSYGITVYPTPAPITPSITNLCLGTTQVYADATSGGIWSSLSTAVATVSASGVVTPVSTGVTTISYTLAGCFSVLPVTVNPLPVVSITPYALPLINCDGRTFPLTASSSISGTTFSWSPSTYVSPSTGPGVLYLGAGSATIVVTGTTPAGCSSTATTTVSPPDCGQAYCGYTAAGPIYQLSGPVGTAGTTTTLPAGNYYVSADVTFLGTVIINNGIVAIVPHKAIKVDQSSSLTLSGCHLFCCDRTQLWTGISLLASTTSSGRLTVNNNTLIEDANTAVAILSPVTPASGNIFTSDGAIYNKNNIDVDIENYLPTTASYPANYPFLIRNSVFTSRKLDAYATSTLSWPNVWPPTNGSVAPALKAPYAAAPANSDPYNIASPTGATGGLAYTPTNCNDGSAPAIGIQLNNVGTNVSAAGNSPASFAQIVIGDNTYNSGGNLNLFDELFEGIYALNTNFTCYNNAFCNMLYQGPTIIPPTGDGIYAQNNTPSALTTSSTYPKFQAQVLGSSSPTAPTYNLFYDCRRGVSVWNYYYFSGQNSDMHSRQLLTPTGQWGYQFTSPAYYQVNISYNTITNMAVGISMNSSALTTTGAAVVNQFTGQVDIDYNTINSHLGGGAPSTGESVQTGIILNNAYAGAAGSGHSFLGQTNVNNNTMNYVYNGINALNYNMQQLVSSFNTIVVNRNSTTPQYQYGITHANCTNNVINSNTVTGPGWNVPAPIAGTIYGHTGATAGSPANPMIEGIFSNGNNLATVICNYVARINTGYHFLNLGTAPNTGINNIMNENAYGFLIRGFVGFQTSTGSPCYNDWHLSSTSLWTGLQYNTWTENVTPPTPNTLIVTNNTATDYFDPPNNRGDFSPGTWYGGGTAIGVGLQHIDMTPIIPTCEATVLAHTPLPLVPVAQHTNEYLTMNRAQNWIAQNALYGLLTTDSSYGDSSTVLAQFQSMAASSRYGWLASIGNAIASGDAATASGLLSAGIDAYSDTLTDSATGVVLMDGTGADNIVQHYIDLYGVYIDYMDTLMTGVDSITVTTLANLCPYTEGNAVFMARAFYRILFQDDTTQFNDQCGADSISSDSTGARGDNPEAVGLNQHYTLFPNPNNGNFTLQQRVSCPKNIEIVVQDLVGKTVLHENIQFVNGQSQLNINQLNPGMYLLKLADAQNHREQFKFIIQK